MELRNRVAIIGGSSKGLGKGCAVELAKSGADLVLCARNAESLSRTAEELRSFGIRVLEMSGDMADPQFNHEIVSRAIATFGRIDILVNNSGGPKAGKFDTISEADWIGAFNSVLMYAIRMTNLVLPYMRENGWGRIVNIASLSVKEPAETLILSNVFRTGLVAFSRTITKDLIRSGITINTICPGAFMTDRATELINAAAKAADRSAEDVRTENQAKLPLGRYQTPDELGAMVKYLCSDIAGGVTGTVMQIDGGIFNGLI